MQGSENPHDLLEKIKNLSLEYNKKVTPRRQIQVQKPQDAFELLWKNRVSGKNKKFIRSSYLFF